MATEARKKRRKRNQYRNKLNSKRAELDSIIAHITYLTLQGDRAFDTYKITLLNTQKIALLRKVARLENILASLSPKFGEKGLANNEKIVCSTEEDNSQTA